MTAKNPDDNVRIEYQGSRRGLRILRTQAFTSFMSSRPAHIPTEGCSARGIGFRRVRAVSLATGLPLSVMVADPMRRTLFRTSLVFTLSSLAVTVMLSPACHLVYTSKYTLRLGGGQTSLVA